MDELILDGKTYISSKRAAAVTGYAKDYIGQLCREGRVEARLVGRSWYVYEPSLAKHRFSKEGDSHDEAQESIEDDAVQPVERAKKDDELEEEKTDEPSEITNVEAVWESPRYEQEEAEPLPLVDEMQAPQTVEEIENAWKDWFAVTQTPAVPTNAPIEAKPQQEEEAEEVPLHIVHEAPRERIERQEMNTLPRKVSHKRKARSFSGSSTVYRAVFIGVMVISLAVGVIGSGVTDIGSVSKNELGIIKFLKGVNEIK